MAKQYLTVNGQLVMHNGKLIQVPDPDSINDLLDEQDGYATQLKQLSDDVSNLALNGLVDGTPRGSFQTLEQLQSAYPDGTPGIYVITKTGEWCYYNEGWKIGGNYIEPDSGGGASITANIKITGNKDDILGTTEHNKLCILSNTGDLSFKVVDKIEGGTEELSTLSTVLPQALKSSCSARYNNNIYIFGGYNGYYQNTIYKFNCATETITTLSITLPQLLGNACCSIHNDNIYIFGGFDGNCQNTIYKFNCSTETITTLSATLPQKLYYLSCSTYNNNIYVFGGVGDGDISQYIYRFNCTNETISTLSVTLPKKLYGHCCSVHNDNIFIFGGFTPTGNEVLNTIYKFDCTNETITTLSTVLPQKLYYISCSIHNDNIYIFGGYNGTSIVNTIYKFNCINESITTLSSILPQQLYEVSCSTYNSNIYIFGGSAGNSNYSKAIYNFSVSFELAANNVLIYNANNNYSFDLITDQVTIPIKNVYIGDSNNTAQLAKAYLYDESKMGWVNVNTGEVLS